MRKYLMDLEEEDPYSTQQKPRRGRPKRKVENDTTNGTDGATDGKTGARVALADAALEDIREDLHHIRLLLWRQTQEDRELVSARRIRRQEQERVRNGRES